MLKHKKNNSINSIFILVINAIIGKIEKILVYAIVESGYKFFNTL